MNGTEALDNDTSLMTRSSEDKSIARLFLVFCMVHFAFWVLIPTLVQPNACLDTIEMLYWGHEWQFGYAKHPPLPAWIAETSASLFGPVIWPIHVISQLLILGCFWSAWTVARPVLGSRAALMSVMLLEGCHYYQYASAEFNNNSLSRGAWALTIAFLFHAFSTHQLRYWALCGLTLGLGMLSKYDTAFLAMTMVAFSVWHPQGRTAWKTPGPLLALGVSLLCFLPHLVWLIENHFPTLHYVQNRQGTPKHWHNHFIAPLVFALKQLAAIGPLLALATIPLGWKWRRQEAAPKETAAGRDFILFFALVPIALILFVGFISGGKMKALWGSPLFTLAGPALFCLFQYREDLQTFRRSLTWSAGFGLLAVAVLALHDGQFLPLAARPSRVHFPGQELARHVDHLYQQESGKPLKVVAGSYWVAGNAAFYSESRPSVYAELDEAITPWMSDELLAKQGGAILWEEKEFSAEELAAIQRRFPQMKLQEPFEILSQGADPQHPNVFHVAIVPPESSIR